MRYRFNFILIILLFISLIHFVQLARKRRGYHLLSPIYLTATFTNNVIQVANEIVQLQEAYRQDPTHLRYILPVYLYETNILGQDRISDRPLFFSLNVESTGQEFPLTRRSFSAYLYLTEVYENYREDGELETPLFSGEVRYTDSININVNPRYELYRGDVINNLSNRQTQIYTIRVLALVFVESIRFSQVRDSVQNGINRGQAVQFGNPILSTLILNWDDRARDLSRYIQNADSDDPAPDQQFTPEQLNTMFSIRVAPISVILTLLQFQLRNFMSCRNPQRKLRRRSINSESEDYFTCGIIHEDKSQPSDNFYPQIYTNVRLFNHYECVDQIYGDHMCWLECFYSKKVCKASLFDAKTNECCLYGDNLAQARERGFNAHIFQSFNVSEIPSYTETDCCGLFSFGCCCRLQNDEIRNMYYFGHSECADTRGCYHGWFCDAKIV